MSPSPFETDNFKYEDWEFDKNNDIKEWHNFHKEFLKNKTSIAKEFNIRPNMIDFLRPFVNKRGVRNSNFRGDEHEVRLVQLDNIPGNAKLVYKNIEKQVGEMIPVYINSKESMRKDLESVAKKLYKKAKKINT